MRPWRNQINHPRLRPENTSQTRTIIQVLQFPSQSFHHVTLSPLSNKILHDFSTCYGNPLKYSCLENPMNGGAWWATVHRVAKSRTRLKRLSSSLVITFLPRSKCLLISWLQSPSAVILEPQKIKSDTVSTVSPSISHEVIWSALMKWENHCNK